MYLAPRLAPVVPIPVSCPSIPRSYKRREPGSTVFHGIVREHLETMLAEARASSDSGAGLPFFVERELRAYIDCGDLSRGFLRVRCDDCGDELLVGFSCKGRAACPSCATRRMQDGAERILDFVLPPVPIRQWVTSYPKSLRVHLAADAELNSRVVALSIAEIFKWQRARARRLGRRGTRVAAICVLQRFGSALQLNPHAHSLLPDGVFGPRYENAPDEPPEFLRIAPPTDDEVEQILHRIVRKIMRLTEKLGLRDRPLSEDAQALALTIALPLPRKEVDEAPPAPRRSAFFRGFSIHANVFCHENDREALRRLVRYALRPPFALERMSLLPSGDVAYKMKKALQDGTETLVLRPVDFLRRVASLVPPPRRHMVKYFGLFAPNARDRSVVVPRPPPTTPDAADAAPTVDQQADKPLRPGRIPWAELLKKVFAFDVFRCDRCPGRRRIVAAIHDASTAARILAHVGIGARKAPLLPARAPPPPAQLGLDPAGFDPCVDPPCMVD